MTESNPTGTTSDTAGAPAAHPGRPVVVGIDGSEPARSALLWATRYAGLEGAVVRAIAVVDQPPVRIGADQWFVEPEYEQAARAWLERTLDALDEDARDVVVESVIVRGEAADALLEQTRDAHVLVLGNSGRGAVGAALSGSVAARCVHHATCPVVLVPGS